MTKRTVLELLQPDSPMVAYNITPQPSFAYTVWFMVTRGGVEPTVLAVKGRCLNHLTNEPCVARLSELSE